MQVNKKWLIAAPLLGAFLVLGPLSQREGSTSNKDESPAKSESAEPPSRIGAAANSGPGLWQILSTTAGLLLLAGVGLTYLSKLRNDRGTQSGSMVSLRQTLRLGQKSRLHAVQFDDHLLLLGETEHGVSLLREMNDPSVAADETEILTREAPADTGAEPRDLARLQAERSGRAIPMPNTPALPAGALGDFKALLRRAKAGKVS